jgi:predicted nucleotidyltransferase
VKGWGDVPADQREVLLHIKKVVQSFARDCNVSLFGSRIKGYWTEKSDYDITVGIYLPDESLRKSIESYNYGVKVHVFYSTRKWQPDMLLIP